MKKFIKGMLLTILCLTLCSCGNKTLSAKDCVSDMLDSYKAQNWSKAASYFEEEDVFTDMSFIDGESEEDIKYQNTLLEQMCDIEYEIIDSKEETDSATVTVKINAKNVGDMFIQGIYDAYTFALSDEINDMDSEAIEKKVTELMYTPLTSCTRTVEKTVTLNLVKNDNLWVIRIDNTDLLDAMMGELLTKSAQFMGE